MADHSPAAGNDPQAQRISSLDQLLIPFHEAIKPPERHRIGAEAEKFGVDAHTGAPLPYEGEHSVLTVLEALIDRHGWHAERETPDGPIIALLRAGEDALRKVRVASRLSPLVTAIFANSPFYEGHLTGGRSFRANVWLSVDPDRQGLVPAVLERGRRFLDYIEWALDAPMFLIKRGGQVVENTGQSFRSFMKYGFRGHYPTLKDWETHLNTLFPEVRLKRTIEVRGADSLPANLVCALPALWTGVLYDARALDEAEELTASFTAAELEALRPAIAEKALGATFRGAPLADLAVKLVEISSGGLSRRARLNKNGKDETAHLARLAALVDKGYSPADALVEGLGNCDADLRQEILARARI
jgi:glutamate--cysteine ligase